MSRPQDWSARVVQVMTPPQAWSPHLIDPADRSTAQPIMPALAAGEGMTAAPPGSAHRRDTRH